VVNLCLDFTTENPLYVQNLKDAIDNLIRLGVNIVISTSNNGCGINFMLARMPDVITV